MPKRVAVVIAVLVVVVVLSIVIAIAGLYGSDRTVTKPVHTPLAFNLSTYPNNGTILQGQNITIDVKATYLEGQPEPIMLSATGGPNGPLYQFSNQTGTPTQTRPFRSNLTFFVPPSAASSSVLIDIASNSSTQTSHGPFNLIVLNAEIQVTGNVTIDSKVYLSGVTLDVIPTDIVFKSNSTGETYQAKIHRFTDTDLAPSRTGNYSIVLPN